MGHAEPASGLCSIAKLVIAAQHGYLPPNLHFNTPNKDIKCLIDGRISIVNKKTPFPGGYVGINSFGFGGSNTHVVLKTPEFIPSWKEEEHAFPKILLYSGRTQESVENVFDKANRHSDDKYFHQLLLYQANMPVKSAPYRGIMILGSDIMNIQKVKSIEARPIWFIYSGMGTQWPEMAKQLLSIPEFKKSIIKSSTVLEEYGIDLYDMIKGRNEKQYEGNVLNCMVSIAAIQVNKKHTISIKSRIIFKFNSSKYLRIIILKTLEIIFFSDRFN